MTPDGAQARGVPDLVWYVAYGSNMHFTRLAYYLRGGRPPGAARVYPGCRDRSSPVRTTPVFLRGELSFALESAVWTGGQAFYDRGVDARTPGRAYLLTRTQFADIAAQEMHREPGADLDLTEAIARGSTELGPGRYETLVGLGTLDGFPALTFTAPWSIGDVAHNRPSAAYLRAIASGLREAHGWGARRAAAYLAGRPGAANHWSAEEIAEVVRAPEAA